MSTTTDLIHSVKRKDFVGAKTHFASIMEQKMRKVLTREFKKAGKNFFSSPKKSTPKK